MKLLSSLDELDRMKSAAMPVLEANGANELIWAVRELEATMSPLRAALGEVLSGKWSPELEQRLEALGTAYLKKANRVQTEIANYQTASQSRWLNAAQELGFLGVRFSTSLSEFARQLPDGVISRAQKRRISGIEPDAAELCGRTSYELRDLKTFYSADFHFLDEDLYEMSVWYDRERARRLGGFTGIEKRLVEKLGPPHELGQSDDPRAPIERIWRFPKMMSRP